MRIGINLLYLLPGIVGGTETYAEGLLSGLSQVNNEDDFFVFVNKESADWPIPVVANFTKILCPVKATNRYARYFYEQVFLPFIVARHKIDVLHSLGYVAPLFSLCSSVVTVPDMNYKYLYNSFSKGKRFFLKYFSERSIYNAAHVITISNFSKKEIMSNVPINPNKITVTYLAASGNNLRDMERKKDGEILAHYFIKKPFLICMGSNSDHKNIHRLVEVFSLLRDKIPHSLVITGHLAENFHAVIKNDYADLNNRIFTTGYVPRHHLHALLSAADLFVFPSLYEGFGLPVLEAQHAGVAVASSHAASLPEVGGKGALYFNPESLESMTRVIELVLSDDNLRRQLIIKGYENLKKYSWDNTAEQTLRIYKKVFNKHKKEEKTPR